jgi:hypothetical protein
MDHGAGGEAVIAANGSPFRQNISLGAVSLLGRPRVPLEIAIEALVPAIESVEIMLRAELPDRTESSHSSTLG